MKIILLTILTLSLLSSGCSRHSKAEYKGKYDHLKQLTGTIEGCINHIDELITFHQKKVYYESNTRKLIKKCYDWHYRQVQYRAVSHYNYDNNRSYKYYGAELLNYIKAYEGKLYSEAHITKAKALYAVESRRFIYNKLHFIYRKNQE